MIQCAEKRCERAYGARVPEFAPSLSSLAELKRWIPVSTAEEPLSPATNEVKP